MTEEIISVIIPVYNMSQYLDACLSSVVNQTYPYLEILLVDDGSKDDSLKKCREWEEKDSRIRVFHKQNGGQGSARNLALDNATGEYIGFIDSDDIIKNDMFDVLLSLLKSEDADLAVSRTQNFCNENDEEEEGDGSAVVMTAVEAMQDRFSGSRYISDSPCNKLYKASMLKDIRFLEDRLLEDSAFMYRIIYRCRKIAYIDKIGYMIRCDMSSVSRRKYSSRRCDTITTYEEIVSFFSDKEEYKFLIGRMQSFANGAVFYNAGEFFASKTDDKKAKEFIKKHAAYQRKNYRYITNKNRAVLFMIQHFFALYGIFYKKTHK